jgi:hypothetical protein
MTCPVEECGQTFSRQNRARHLRDVHHIKPDSAEWRRLLGQRPKNAAREEQKTSYSLGVEQRIHEIAKPLRDELRGITKRLSELDTEAQQLREGRRKIEQVLRKIDPTSFVAAPKKAPNFPGSHQGSDEMKEAKRQGILKFIEANHDKYAEGFTAAGVYRDMKAAGVEPISAPNRILALVQSLHADGVLRADKKIRGGAMQYKFVSNGASDGEA